MMFSSLLKNEQLRTTLHFKKIWHETLSYLGHKLWNLVPSEYKTIESLADFKSKIKT